MIINWRWFISKSLRDAREERKQVVKLLCAQQDLIKPTSIEEIREALQELDTQSTGKLNNEELKFARDNLLTIAERNLISYPDAKYRDWAEMFLVVATLVLTFRSFFFQPFKIPTGSMQPTLYGITHNSIDESGEMPNFGGRLIDRLKGYSYHSLKADRNCTFVHALPPKRVMPLISKQTLVFLDNEKGSQFNKTVWLPPMKAGEPLIPKYIIGNDSFNKGEYIYKIQVKTGDHLFVNRITYNFRKPKRGDIAVFVIKRDYVSKPPEIQVDWEGNKRCAVPLKETFYIKRLVALGKEHVTIGNDRHLVINGNRLDSANPGFEFVYSRSNGLSKKPKELKDSVYSGHSGQSQNYPGENIFENGPYNVPDGHYLMMGDNTSSSSDSRFWGGVLKKQVIGHSSFVYWPPLSPRFGWSHH